MSNVRRGRNNQILRMHRDGISYGDIADEFGISDTRVRQICHDTRVREHRGPDDVPAIKQACEELNAAPNMYSMILHSLFEGDLFRFNRWKKLRRYEIIKIRRLGEKAADILQRAQEIANEKK